MIGLGERRRYNAGMRCSADLRKRVIEFVCSGGSKAEAARRFSVGEASVCRWLKPGGLTHKRPDPKTARKLDWEALRRQVETQADWSQKERAKHFGVSRHCIWNAWQKMALTRKKNDGRQRARPDEKKKVSAPS